jgi:hypothetical protein
VHDEQSHLLVEEDAPALTFLGEPLVTRARGKKKTGAGRARANKRPKK